MPLQETFLSRIPGMETHQTYTVLGKGGQVSGDWDGQQEEGRRERTQYRLMYNGAYTKKWRPCVSSFELRSCKTL